MSMFIFTVLIQASLCFSTGRYRCDHTTSHDSPSRRQLRISNGSPQATFVIYPVRSVGIMTEQQQQRRRHPHYFQSTIVLQASATDTASSTPQELSHKTASTHNKRQHNPRSVAVAALRVMSNNESATTNGRNNNKKPRQKKQSSDFSVRRLENDPAFQGLSDQRDRSFARLLVATVERRMGQIDKVLSSSASVYPPKKGKHAALVQACLRVGAAQLLFLETPQHAALKETVEVLKQQGYLVPEPMVKFVNAVLRSISRHGQELLSNSTSSTDNIAPWLIQEWEQDWGPENTRLISDQAMREPFIDLSVKASLQEREVEELRSQLSPVDGAAVRLPHNNMIRTEKIGGAVHLWPRFHEGIWWVQDASSTLPALALCRALAAHNTKNDDNDLTGLHVVDMCSAPGGKCAQLLSSGIGHVTAIEANARRSRRLVENLDRLGYASNTANYTEPTGEEGSEEGRYSLVVTQGQDWTPSPEKEVHGVLLDVPCSATGTGSRRPEVLRKDPTVLSNGLLETQEALANHCADVILRKGGILVYSTCSLLKRESEDQVDKLISKGSMKTLPILPGEIPGFDNMIDTNGWLRVLPGVSEGHLRSCDGFFVARLIKVVD